MIWLLKLRTPEAISQGLRVDDVLENAAVTRDTNGDGKKEVVILNGDRPEPNGDTNLLAEWVLRQITPMPMLMRCWSPERTNKNNYYFHPEPPVQVAHISSQPLKIVKQCARKLSGTENVTGYHARYKKVFLGGEYGN